jgi:hypothetical protein
MSVLKRLVSVSACGGVFAIGLAFPGSPASARGDAGDAYVLGDSIGEGVAIASGLKKLARISVHIRGPKAIDQINATPIGAVAFIVLGTNDAEGSLKDIERSIDDVVRAGKRRKLTMIWLGPPCVRRSFDSKSRQLDKILSDRLPGVAVKYVSMRDESICSGVFHEPDGVHLTMRGYRYMWAKAEKAVSWPHLTAVDAQLTMAGPQNGVEASPQDSSTRIGPMIVEIHKPPPGASLPIVWTGVSN